MIQRGVTVFNHSKKPSLGRVFKSTLLLCDSFDVSSLLFFTTASCSVSALWQTGSVSPYDELFRLGHLAS